MDLRKLLQDDPTEIRVAAVRELTSRSLLDFVRCFWHVLEPSRELKEGRVLYTLCEHLEAVADGTIRKIIINIPPRHAKSLIVSCFFPVWLWGPKARAWMRFINASYSADLSLRDNRRSRQLIESSLFQACWGDEIYLTSDQNAKERFDTNQNGFRIATSVGGLATGEGADVFIVDDPHNVKDGESDAKREAALLWAFETVPTRVIDPMTSCFVWVMQRVHEKDCSGALLAADLGYEHLCLPMRYEPDHPTPSRTSLGFEDWRTEAGELLWTERFPEEYVADLEKTLGPYAVAGQLQQRPGPRGGGMFKREHLPVVDEVPPEHLVGARVCRGWDLASSKKKKSAFTASAKILETAVHKKGEEPFVYILDVTRKRLSPEELDTELVAVATMDGDEVVQSLPNDPGAAGDGWQSHIERLEGLRGLPLHFSPETGEKFVRALPLAGESRRGRVRILRGSWNDAFIHEAEIFDHGFKDQIDAASRARNYLTSRRRKKPKGKATGPMVFEA